MTLVGRFGPGFVAWRPSPACSRTTGQQDGGTAIGGKMRSGDSTARRDGLLRQGLGYKYRRVPCPPLTCDLCQPISASGTIPLGTTAVAKNSRCAVSQRSPWSAGAFLRDYIFRDESGEERTKQPADPFVGAAIMATVIDTNPVDSESTSF